MSRRERGRRAPALVSTSRILVSPEKEAARARRLADELTAWDRDMYPDDYGEGVRGRWMLSGDLMLLHLDDAGRRCGTYVDLASRDAKHAIQVADELTISPNITCAKCGHSGFIRDGRWVPL